MSAAEKIIRLDGVSVHIPLRGVDKLHDLGKDDRLFVHRGQLHLRALNGVTLDIRQGERVGLWGANGSGKTTLLKLTAGMLPADQGQVEISGKVRALVALGGGTIPALSGRKNVELRYALLALNSVSLRDYVVDVEVFTELGPFFDLPVGTYSPGMLSRLQFAMNTVETADLLVLDEWLGVADQAFQEKAEERLQSLINRSKSLLLASHDSSLLHRLTDRVLTLERGRVVDDCETQPHN